MNILLTMYLSYSSVHFQAGRNNGKQEFLYERDDGSISICQSQDLRPAEDTWESQNINYPNDGIGNYSFSSSPCETWISDWISELSSDQSLVKYHQDYSIYSPGWISEESNIWDYSGPLWNMN